MKNIILNVFFCCISTVFLAHTSSAQNKAINLTSGYIDIPGSSGSSALNFTNDSFTLEAWIKPEYLLAANNYNHTILGNDNQTSSGAGYVLRTGGYRNLSFAYSYGSGWHELMTTSAVIDTAIWQHVAVTKKAGEVKLYLNGQLVAADTFVNTQVSPSSKTLKIGENGSNNNRNFWGLIDEVKIWNTARTMTQVQEDMKEICSSSFPVSLLAYYRLNDTGTTSANHTIVCANNPSMNGVHNNAIASERGAILYNGTATTLYVDSAAVTSCATDGSSWSTAFSDLNEAIIVAHSNPLIEKVLVARGTYYPTNFPFELLYASQRSKQMRSTDNEDLTFHLRPGLELYGGYPNGGGTANPALYHTILDGGSANDTACNVVYMCGTASWTTPNDTTKLVGFTVRNGKATLDAQLNISGAFGGGIYCYFGTHLIQNCIITNNRSLNGGAGIYIKNATAVLTSNTITYNSGLTTSGAGGGLSTENSYINVSDNYFSKNSQAAIASSGGSSHIESNTIEFNASAGINQGSMVAHIINNDIHHNGRLGISFGFMYNGSYISGNRISNHTSTSLGAGIHLYGGTQSIINNVLENDTAFYGGGLYSFNGNNQISGNVIKNCVGTNQGGGMWCQGVSNTILNNAIINCSAKYGGGAFIDKGGDTVVFAHNTIVGNTATIECGGVRLNGHTVLAVNNIIANNHADAVGGMECSSWVDSISRVINNVFYNNTANYATGGLSIGYYSKLYNNIFWKNKLGNFDTVKGADYIGFTINTFRYNAMQLRDTAYTSGTGGSYDIGAYAADNYFNTDPQFANPNNIAGPDGVYGTADDGLQLLRNSPFIDSGSNSLFPSNITTDIKKQTRVYGYDIDLGAYEIGCLPANISALQQVNICPGSAAMLHVNSTAPYKDIKWYTDSLNTNILDTGYYYNTSVLNNTDTFWVAATGCAGGQRTPVIITVHQPVTTKEIIKACDSFLWAQTNTYYYASGIYIDTTSNIWGCDSFVSLDLTIGNTTDTTTKNVTACDSFFWNQTNQNYTVSGTYRDTLTSITGCDSIIILNLIIDTTTAQVIQNGTTLQANNSSSASSYQWLKCNPYTVIPGATSSTFQLTSNGDYSVVITSNGCTDTSACITVTGINVEKINNDFDIKIRPNPTNGFIVISSPGNTEFTLFDAYGRRLAYYEISKGENTIQLPQYIPNGIYTGSIEGRQVRINLMR